MKDERELRRRLAAADRRGYPAYKSLRGSYRVGEFILSIDHVQGDPFAAPSSVSVHVPARVARIDADLYDAPHRRVALEDLLTRRFAAEAARVSFKVGGSGKSGLIATSALGPEVLARSACSVSAEGVTVHLEAGFPAHGRTTDARALERMLLDLIYGCAERALVFDDRLRSAARKAVNLADDQRAIRQELERRGLVAFVADGSVLPRESGVSSRPLKGAHPFTSPESLRVELDLPRRGRVTGMGIPRGVTLVVGGGYHGKSTLLKALQEGVYNHVTGDGRELVVTDASAMKLRAEDGRIVRSVDISPFIDNLPDGRDTRSFSTLDASGSTSQAANTMEALEAGARTLLIDEDTSATNFMVRDLLMEEVVAADHEPITPFVERVRSLWEDEGVSCVLVVGSSGAFFPVADTVVQMDRYEALDVTDRVRSVCRAHGLTAPQAVAVPDLAPAWRNRRVSLRAGAPKGGKDCLKVRSHGLEGFSVGKGEVDLWRVEQLVDPEQTAALAQMVRLIAERGMLDGSTPLARVVSEVLAEVETRGWEALDPYGEVSCGLALPRAQELFCALNRWRA